MLQGLATIAGNEGWIGCITYKSRATATPSPSDLHSLVGKARARNRKLNVTGMLLYENGSFLQTLEGPPDKLDALWASIKQDSRHDHIEVLSEHVVPARVFSNWDLLLHSHLDKPSASAVAARSVPEAVDGYIKSLVRLALEANDIGLGKLIDSLAERGWKSGAIVTLLIEPAARALGDAWLADECSELDLTIGLSMLQLAGHEVRYEASGQSLRNGRYSILLATAPGEAHMLGTSLLADQFTDAGWDVEMAFPDSDEALANQLSAQHPDAVDIALSDAFMRQHTLGQLRATVEHSRLASPDQPTVISVGGRLFAEAAATAKSVGADHARMTAAGASIRMAELVRQSRVRRADGDGLVEGSTPH
ncbi:MAG: BLUF domain-containing protein [Erythrobacter sp.]|nr:MAG: BLUF domain-containing protein [Erythrobacter sp.]